MKRFYQVAIVTASTALTVAFAGGMLRLFGTPLAQHFPGFLLGEKGDGGPFIFLFNLGFIAGVGLTLAVLGGLLSGLALARCVGKRAHSPGLRAA